MACVRKTEYNWSIFYETFSCILFSQYFIALSPGFNWRSLDLHTFHFSDNGMFCFNILCLLLC